MTQRRNSIKILLIMPSYPSSPFPGPNLPIGLGYLAEQLEKCAISYEICDLSIEGKEKLFKKITDFAPENIGISLMSLDIEHHYDLLREIKGHFPGITIIAGGAHISFAREKSLAECHAIDFGILHEGEYSLTDLLNGVDVTCIDGLLYRDQFGNVTSTPHTRFIEDMDSLSYPRYKKFDLAKYGTVLSIASSRGCPFSCTFCGAHLSMGRKWRARSASSVFQEISYWYSNGYKSFNFVDSNFFMSHERVIAFCDALETNHIAISISCDGMRAKDAEPEMLKKMKGYGLTSVAIGIESANDDILKNIKKGECLKDIQEGLRILQELEISVIAFFIIGLPGETIKHVLKSFLFALRHPVIAHAYFFNVNPLFGTELYYWANNHNFLKANVKSLYENIGGMGDEILVETPDFSAKQRKILYRISKHIARIVAEKSRLKRGNLSVISQYLLKLIWHKFQYLLAYSRRSITDRLHILQKKRVLRQSKYPEIFSIFTHLTEQERVTLFSLSQQLSSPCPVIVEIGSYLGASTCFLAAGIRSKKGTVYAIDTWMNDGMTEGSRDTYQEFLCNITPLKDWILPLRGTSETHASAFSHRIDLLFLDGEHSYEHCYNDWMTWKTFLKPGGVVIFHDIEWAEGVQQVVSQEVSPQVKKEGRLPNLYWAWV